MISIRFLDALRDFLEPILLTGAAYWGLRACGEPGGLEDWPRPIPTEEAELRPRLSYANVVSTACLFVLLGGAAYAAVELPKNSVGKKQLKKNAVTGIKVKDRSLTGSDLDLGTLGTVPRAASADSALRAGTAADAAALQGLGAGAFVHGNGSVIGN